LAIVAHATGNLRSEAVPLQAPGSGISDATISFVKPPKDDPSRSSYHAWWALLFSRQRLALAALLRAVPESIPGEHSEAENA
jgi:hypothetical protein